MNNVKLLHNAELFFQFSNSPVALKNWKKFCPPKKKLKWRPWLGMHVIMHLFWHVFENLIIYVCCDR